MVFFQRFWVGRHARYPNERVEALKKWNFHNMAPLIFISALLALSTSLHYLLCLQFTAPVYSHSSLYIFLRFLRPLCCCDVLRCVVLYILCKYTESHLTRSQIPCLCKLTWPIKPDSDSDSDGLAL